MDIVRKGEDGTNWESDIDMYTIPCVKQIASGKLLYSPGSSALCDDLEGWGGGVGERYKREGTYVYRWLIHCCTAETNTTL